MYAKNRLYFTKGIIKKGNDITSWKSDSQLGTRDKVGMDEMSK